MFIRIYNIDSLVMNTLRTQLTYNADIVYYKVSDGDVYLLKNRFGERGRMSGDEFKLYIQRLSGL